MSYLLDTHILLWARLEPNKLSNIHKVILQSPVDQKFISTVTIWEISLKFSLGKLDLGNHSPEEFMESAYNLGFQVLSPSPEQFASFHLLPQTLRHKDPFDRMLIWQAINSKLTLLSNDQKLASYKLHGLAIG